jgi:hypothetical protein
MGNSRCWDETLNVQRSTLNVQWKKGVGSETPNPKPQSPEKLQTPITKIRASTFWILMLGDSLEFGDWDLEFPIGFSGFGSRKLSEWVVGIWTFMVWSRRCRLRAKLRRAEKAAPTFFDR